MLPTFGETINDPDLWERIKKLLRGSPPPDPETAPMLPTMTAEVPDPELLNRHGWRPNVPPGVQEAINTPFVQDTIRAVLGELPMFGTAEGNPHPGAYAFVDPELRHRVYMNPHIKGGGSKLGELLFHEAVHTQQDDNPEIRQLMEDMSEDYDTLLRGLLEQDPRDRNRLSVAAARTPYEHTAYAMEAAMSWLRGSDNPEELDLLEELFPGTKRARDFILNKLNP